MNRRRFLVNTSSAATLSFGCRPKEDEAKPPPVGDDPPPPEKRPRYEGPNVILIRFGGGVRRQETIADESETWCPFVMRELAKKGVLFSEVEMADSPGIITSHGQGTLYLLTGRYDRYEDVEGKALGDRFEPKAPTIFEYLRRHYDVPAHETLIINGEDRINEEFYTFSNHHLYGVAYRSTVLSLYRFKTYLLRKELANPGKLSDREIAAKRKQLQEMEQKDFRVKDEKAADPELDRFWDCWQTYYGKSGLKNPRGDRVLTALALRALEQLRPKLLMVNYQDPDYVHWGNAHFYTRAISVIDEGIREIYSAVQADLELRKNTWFIIVPDCGRDNNPLVSVPYQHHSNSRSAREIFALVIGPDDWKPRGKQPRTSPQQQISVARTIGEIMNFPTPHADAPSLFKNL